MAEEFVKPISHSTEAPEPAGSVEVDGVQHTVWKPGEAPFAGVKYAIQLMARHSDLARISSEPTAALDDPDLMCLTIRAYAPSLGSAPLETMRGMSLFNLFMEVTRIVAPFVDGDEITTALRSLGMVGGKPKRSSRSRTRTPSERTSRSRTTGPTSRSTA